jgi:hypothetical protein
MTSTTTTLGKDVTGEVRHLARELKAPAIGEMFSVLGDQSREEGWSPGNSPGTT